MAAIYKLWQSSSRLSSIRKCLPRNFSIHQSVSYKKKEPSLPTDNANEEDLQFFTTHMATAADVIVSEKLKAVTFITLNRPEHKNQLNKSMIDKFIEAVEKFENDNSSHVAVLSGIDGNLCTGYDLDDLAENLAADENHFQDILRAFRIPNKPMIASISGLCTSAGLELALICDYRIMEDNAVICVGHKDIYLPLIGEGASKLGRIIGHGRALDLVLGKSVLSAKEAKNIGLVNATVNVGTGMGRAFSAGSLISHLGRETVIHNRNLMIEHEPTGNVTVSRIFRDEVLKSTEKLNAKKVESYAGVKKLSHVFDVNTLADWEKDEYYREINRKNEKTSK